MPLSSYGALVVRALDRRVEAPESQTPHYQIHVADESGTHFRVAVNVRSQQQPPDLLSFADDDFHHPVTERLRQLPPGWTPLAGVATSGALDFVRGNLFAPSAVRPVPAGAPGPDNDLGDMLDHYVLRAINDASATLYVLGERWGPEADIPDKVFGFSPGNGVHDVHMNQGNSGSFTRDNSVWQDGALLIHFGTEDRWVAVFLAFQSQTWHTDDATGDPLPAGGGDAGGSADQGAGLRIVAALVNPVGPDPEPETVTLINPTPQPVPLTGWRIADLSGHACTAGEGTVAPGAVTVIPVTNGMHLGNRGGGVSLLDATGRKVHGVSYTADQARREGWTLVF
jgi:uncharacterized protein YukJ